MKKYILQIVTLIMLLPIMTSCHDELDTEPISTLAPENFFNDLEEAEIAVNGVYDAMAEHYGQHFLYMSDHGSHVATSTLGNSKLNTFAWYSFDSSNGFNKDNWQTAYKAIYRANVVINRVGLIETDDNLLKNRIIAEAKFLRALTYFNLVRFYGDIPLVLEELLDFDTIENVNRARTASSSIYDAIIEDLKFAEENLYVASFGSYGDTPSYDGGNLGRATIGAAKGLLAKVYLTRASFPERDAASHQLAYNKAKEVIDNHTYYQLDSDYFNLNSLEGKTSQEWMFQIQYRVEFEQNSRWGGLHNPRPQGSGGNKANDVGYGRISPTFKFANSFEDGDVRFGSIFKGKINEDGSLKYFPKSVLWHSHKYRFSIKPLSKFNTDMSAPVLRYADILLIYAEAANELGLDGDAYDALDEILMRAQNGGTVPALVDRSLVGDDLKEFILWERARELCFEGHAKFDIVRAGEDKFMAEVQGQQETTDESNPAKTKVVKWSNNVQPYHLLYPIPAAEMAANPSIGQNNPGYN